MNAEILEAYNLTRLSIGYYRLTDLRAIEITGEDRFSWLQGMISNDVRRLEKGETNRLPACILNATGHLVAEISILVHDAKALLLVADVSQIQTVYDLLDRYLITEDVELRLAEEIAFATFQGPDAKDELPTGVLTFENDRSGLGGYDAIYKASEIEAAIGAREMPLEALEALRIEAGIPATGKELDERVIPLEANLAATHFSFVKGCYVGQEIIARIDSRGHTNRGLSGFVAVEGTPLVGYPLFHAEEPTREIGRITSVLDSSPLLHGRAIALGYLRHEHRTDGLIVQSANGKLKVAALPFTANSSSE